MQINTRILLKIINKAKDALNFANNAIITLKIGNNYFGLGGEGARKLIKGIIFGIIVFIFIQLLFKTIKSLYYWIRTK